MHRPSVRRLALGAVAALGLAAPATASAGAAPGPVPGTRPILVVGNNHAGTADVVDPVTFSRLFRMNIVPDLPERLAEIHRDPVRLAFFYLIRSQIGMGHDQLVDDLFPSPDGRVLYVSRPSLADVVAFDLRTHEILWRRPVAGNRSDHMAISPDGARLLVSASTGGVVHAIDTATGEIVADIPSGDQPHESNYSEDGSKIFHASIGTVFTPLDDPIFDAAKGDRVFQIVDAKTYEVIRRIDIGKKLADAGYPGMSSAVRPMAVAPGERYVYLQISFLHGFVEYDLIEDRVTRVVDLPLTEASRRLRRDEYVLDSAHHGLAINPEGTKLCAAGTMSDYAAIVRRSDFTARVIPVGEKPYWSTNSADGRHCYVSVSGADRVAVLSYDEEREIASIPVGDHPQRIRVGRLKIDEPAPGEPATVPGAPAASVPAAPGSAAVRARPGRLTLRAVTRRDRRAPFRLRVSGRMASTTTATCVGTVRVEARRGTVRVGRANLRLRRRGNACVYAGTVKVGRTALRGGRTARLTLQARFGGNALLLPGRSGVARARLG
ncbi:YncE family protein [Patulibacter americanus]|uniref:YncE family protein n=1 Tax=Patulibacter americanus TaxID=588672 RepID=UPI0003FE0C24|nr:PQQ-binding-like beta-propeller repeat protein [Patulibacter americanus]